MLNLRRDLLLKRVKSKPLFPFEGYAYTLSHSSVYVSPNGFTDRVYIGETKLHTLVCEESSCKSEIEILTDAEGLKSFRRLNLCCSVISIVFISDTLSKASAIFDADILRTTESSGGFPFSLSIEMGYDKRNLITINSGKMET